MEGCDPHERREKLWRNELECQICLALPTDPVVTSCGHLYCWPCLHRWLQDSPKPCPVCRAMVRRDSNVIPIYGSQEDNPKDGAIPPRPNPPGPSICISLNSGSNQINIINATLDQVINTSLAVATSLLQINDLRERVCSELRVALEAERARVSGLRLELRQLTASVHHLRRRNYVLIREAGEQARRQGLERQAFLNNVRAHCVRLEAQLRLHAPYHHPL